MLEVARYHCERRMLGPRHAHLPAQYAHTTACSHIGILIHRYTHIRCSHIGMRSCNWYTHALTSQLVYSTACSHIGILIHRYTHALTSECSRIGILPAQYAHTTACSHIGMLTHRHSHASTSVGHASASDMPIIHLIRMYRPRSGGIPDESFLFNNILDEVASRECTSAVSAFRTASQ